MRLYLPPRLDEREITRYPLLVHVYGGPGSQQVNERFQVGWGHRLASAKNVIYALIDGRGSGFKGDKVLHELYHRLGTIEVEDQIQVTRCDGISVGDQSPVLTAAFSGNYRRSSPSWTERRRPFGAGATVAT